MMSVLFSKGKQQLPTVQLEVIFQHGSIAPLYLLSSATKGAPDQHSITTGAWHPEGRKLLVRDTENQLWKVEEWTKNPVFPLTWITPGAGVQLTDSSPEPDFTHSQYHVRKGCLNLHPLQNYANAIN